MKRQIVELKLGPATWPAFEWRKTSDGNGGTSVRIGEDDFDLRCEIDVQKLIADVGVRAARSRKGVSKLQAGAIVVYARKTGQRRGE